MVKTVQISLPLISHGSFTSKEGTYSVHLVDFRGRLTSWESDVSAPWETNCRRWYLKMYIMLFFNVQSFSGFGFDWPNLQTCHWILTFSLFSPRSWFKKNLPFSSKTTFLPPPNDPPFPASGSLKKHQTFPISIQIQVGEAKTMPYGLIQFSAMDEMFGPIIARQVKYWRYQMIFQLAFGYQELNYTKLSFGVTSLSLWRKLGSCSKFSHSAIHVWWCFFWSTLTLDFTCQVW